MMTKPKQLIVCPNNWFITRLIDWLIIDYTVGQGTARYRKRPYPVVGPEPLRPASSEDDEDGETDALLRR